MRNLAKRKEELIRCRLRLVVKTDEEARKYGDLEALGWVKVTALDVMTLCVFHLQRMNMGSNSFNLDDWRH